MIPLVVNFGLAHRAIEFSYELPGELSDLLERFRDQLKTLSVEDLHLLRWRMVWKANARRKQLPPTEFEVGQRTIWGLQSGRGFGKTLAAASWIGGEAASVPGYYAVVAPTHDDVRYTCFEGPTGLDAVIPAKLIADRNSALPSRTLWNGSIIRGFAGDTPERLRGPQHHKAWCDEIASWKYPEDAWSNLMFGLRLGDMPQVCWTSTLKPKPFIKRLLAEPNSVITRGTTYENKANLTKIFFDNVAKYEGTKIGRQELLGELIDPEESGFVRRSQWKIWPANKPLPKFRHIVLSLDTAFTEETFDKKKQEGDPTACSVWGLFTISRPGLKNKEEHHVILLDCWEDYLGFPQLIKRVKAEKAQTYGDADEPLMKAKGLLRPRHTGRKADTMLIETKGSGISLRQSLAAENILTDAYNPYREDKLTRLHLVSPLWAHGRVWAVESAVTPGQFRTWAEPLISQVCSYVGEGSLEHDDLLDTTTQALRYLMDRYFGPFTLTRDPDEEREEAEKIARAQKRKVNPYAQ